MENTNQNLQTPDRTTGSIISHAFEIFKSNFGWGILTIVLIAIVSSIINSLATIFTGYNQLEFSRAIQEMISDRSFDSSVIVETKGFAASNLISSVVSLLLFPLYLGYMYMCQKTDRGENIDYFSDLLIGYRQNTGQIILYALLSSIIIVLSVMLCVFPVFFIAPMLFIGSPIVLFENETAINALSKTFKITKENYGVFLGTAILSVLMAISGIFLCGIGLVITIPFFYVASYSAYVAFCGKPRQLTEN